MTAINFTTDLPTGDRSITTIEELAVWVAQIMREVNATEKRVLISGQAGVNMAQSGTNVDADNTMVRINYQVIDLDPAKVGSSLPDWKKVKAMTTTAIPNSFKG